MVIVGRKKVKAYCGGAETGYRGGWGVSGTGWWLLFGRRCLVVDRWAVACDRENMFKHVVLVIAVAFVLGQLRGQLDVGEGSDGDTRD